MAGVELGIDIGHVAEAVGVLFVGGIVRVELLAYRVRQLENRCTHIEKQVFAVQTEVNTVNDGLVGQLSEIKETLAWIKGRFSLLEEKHKDGSA